MAEALEAYLATLANEDQRIAVRTALADVGQKEIKWTLLNTFMKNRLDLLTKNLKLGRDSFLILQAMHI